ncbi:hypothetical protein [Hymenobacter koreensis]|uniref:Uncharacterized protein n=1 Tax=Hymenobacter koreensis TaxID=1084523 RepID=A0ABP8IX97_9BACT
MVRQGSVTTKPRRAAAFDEGIIFALLQRRPLFRSPQPFLVYVGFILAALLIYTHRANIGRLRVGTESRVPLPWAK